jgi:cardiolipin synthase
MLKFLFHSSTLFIFAQAVILVILGVRVIMRRPPTGVALAWLSFIAAIPGVGAIAYLLVGEKRIGKERTRRIGFLKESFIELSISGTRAGWRTTC